jgi:hypothetical protein
MEEAKVIFTITGEKAKVVADHFAAWFLDGGGEDALADGLESDGIYIELTDWKIANVGIKEFTITV